MEDFDQIFRRMDIHQIRSFLLCGLEEKDKAAGSYEQRIKDGDRPMLKRLESLYPDGEERDAFFCDILQALVVREQVYLEIGKKTL